MFSRLIDDFVGSFNPLARAKADRLATGGVIHDAASGGVHDAGFFFPDDILRDALDVGLKASRSYTPISKGQRVAREAVVAYYGGGDPERVVMTPGTSQSYWYLFSLLADPGDEILVPRPCYPLFDYIAKLCHATLIYYDLRVEDGKWTIDLESVAAAITSKTKAIVLISPHNPTGHVASEDEVRGLAKIVREKGLPLIIDEVFYEFVFEGSGDRGGSDMTRELPQRRGFADCPLVFTVNGFSKMFALPGMKIGWIRVEGRSDLVERGLAALETIADTFLATSEQAQFAVPMIFQRGREFLAEYKKILRQRWEVSRDLYSVIPQGGFYGVRYIGDRDEDVFTIELLRQHGILLHPGYFFMIDRPAIVFSFLRSSELLRTALCGTT